MYVNSQVSSYSDHFVINISYVSIIYYTHFIMGRDIILNLNLMLMTPLHMLNYILAFGRCSIGLFNGIIKGKDVI